MSWLICLNISEVWGGRCSIEHELQISTQLSPIPLTPCGCKSTLQCCASSNSLILSDLQLAKYKMECVTEVAFERVNSQWNHLVSKVAISRPRLQVFDTNMKGCCLLCNWATVEGLVLTHFPADPSGRREEVFCCVMSHSKRDGHCTTADLQQVSLPWHWPRCQLDQTVP